MKKLLILAACAAVAAWVSPADAQAWRGCAKKMSVEACITKTKANPASSLNADGARMKCEARQSAQNRRCSW